MYKVYWDGKLTGEEKEWTKEIKKLQVARKAVKNAKQVIQTRRTAFKTADKGLIRARKAATKAVVAKSMAMSCKAHLTHMRNVYSRMSSNPHAVTALKAAEARCKVTVSVSDKLADRKRHV